MRNTGRPRKTPQQNDNPRQWRDDDSVINSYIFNPDNGDYSVNPDLYYTLYDGSPIDFYHLIVDQNIINNIVIETNKYAAQQIASKVISPHSRLNKWYDTNESEMKCFLGLLMWTGLVSLPSYDLYWSTSVIFKTEFSTFMSRNRFEILLQMIHFADNSKKKLKRGEVISMRSSSNVLVLKWKDKRDLYMLSTKHDSEMISIDHHGKCIEKPKVVIDYNLGKSPIDLSDQLSSYSNPLRRSIKWYKKVVLDTLLNIGVVNSLVLFNKVTNSKMKITAFRTMLAENLVKKNDIMPPEVTMNHDFVKAGRSRCFTCYKKMVSEKGRKYAQNHSTKVYTKCLACNKYYCQMCFMRDHKIKK